jgi:hypothetical protein
MILKYILPITITKYILAIENTKHILAIENNRYKKIPYTILFGVGADMWVLICGCWYVGADMLGTKKYPTPFLAV